LSVGWWRQLLRVEKKQATGKMPVLQGEELLFGLAFLF